MQLEKQLQALAGRHTATADEHRKELEEQIAELHGKHEALHARHEEAVDAQRTALEEQLTALASEYTELSELQKASLETKLAELKGHHDEHLLQQKAVRAELEGQLGAMSTEHAAQLEESKGAAQKQLEFLSNEHAEQVRQWSLFPRFYTNDDPFAKTGSGQTYVGKALTKEWRFLEQTAQQKKALELKIASLSKQQEEAVPAPGNIYASASEIQTGWSPCSERPFETAGSERKQPEI